MDEDEDDPFPTVALHNVASLRVPPWTDRVGRWLCRVPREVGLKVNVGARERYRHPVGAEVRFVPDEDATVSVTLSARAPTAVRPFWGAFQGSDPRGIGPEPTTLRLAVPDRIADLRDPAAHRAGAGFDPRVCRLRFDRTAPVALHGVEGACRPPEEGERPERRYLAYGTSITEGAAATAYHLGYVARTARRIGADAANLGASGSAYCEPPMAEYLAGLDFDLATLSLSVNMANRGFTLAQFRERAHDLVGTVTATNPETPVYCVTLFPYHADLVTGDDGGAERADAFRGALRDAVADGGAHCHLVEGRNLLDAAGLTTDLLHPGDAGMEAIATGLAAEIRE
jgi:lysophospholipase L1-like esterase